MNSAFFSRVRKVLVGTLGAQLVSLSVMLLLVRLYTPDELGFFNVWLSFATIMAVLVTARYELALFSGEKNDDSKALVKLILLIAIFLSIVSTLCLVLFGVFIEQVPSVVRSYSVGLAFVIFGMGINKAALSVLALQQEFNKLGVARILLAIAIALAQVIAGYFALGVSGLIYGQVAGVLLATIFVCLWFERTWLKKCWSVSFDTVKNTARKYRKFPQLSLPADLINTIASQLPIILIAARFGAEPAGLFALTMKIMGAPVTLLATSVLDVFKEQAARDYRNTGNCKSVFLKTFVALALLAIPPFLLFWWLGEWIFTFFFGVEWNESGKYAVLLIPMFYMRFVISPLSYTIYIAQKQQMDLVWQTALLLITCGCFLLAGDVLEALWWYSLSYAIMYAIYFAVSYRCAQGVPS
ncbi:lipopolysaccharide biosynthesis protein [Pseudomonas brassicacearum]|uniref:lipopolysaccharide biosynthesis protein n=1 Tax=Pseudomonas brassicacearum TaxID=930166 RepID=UPI00186772E2|nr:lipopolysaccharide biosynthesis protein [Pseudomonas brassicacearum]QGA52972.2 lipopolysaccharide biosynthesis protein [Pseudomonas brassicacearum]